MSPTRQHPARLQVASFWCRACSRAWGDNGALTMMAQAIARCLRELDLKSLAEWESGQTLIRQRFRQITEDVFVYDPDTSLEDMISTIVHFEFSDFATASDSRIPHDSDASAQH